MDFKAAVGLACACAHLFVKKRLIGGCLFVANVTSFGFGRHGKECWKERKGLEGRKEERKESSRAFSKKYDEQ